MNDPLNPPKNGKVSDVVCRDVKVPTGKRILKILEAITAEGFSGVSILDLGRDETGRHQDRIYSWDDATPEGKTVAHLVESAHCGAIPISAEAVINALKQRYHELGLPLPTSTESAKE